MERNYVTFEQALKLKDKGCSIYGYLQDVWLGNTYEKSKSNKLIEVPVFGLGASSNLPEQWQVVEWLRVEKGIWISVEPVDEFWKFIVFSKNATKAENLTRAFCNTPQEAYSAAFDYVLNNLT